MIVDAASPNDSDQEQSFNDQSFSDHKSEVNFALVLSRVIDQVRSDPSQLRSTVYELARVALEKETQRDPPPNPEEKQRLMAALEVAIEGVESFSSREVTAYLPPYGGNGYHSVPARRSGTDRWVGSPDLLLDAPERVIVIDSPAGGQGRGTFGSVLIRSLVAPLVAALAVVAFGLGIFAVSDRNLAPGSKSLGNRVAAAVETGASSPALQQNSAGAEPFATAQKATGDPRIAGLPLPSVYGVYALSDGQFHELAVLTERVPDPRVRISTPIVVPSRTVLADGHVTLSCLSPRFFERRAGPGSRSGGRENITHAAVRAGGRRGERRRFRHVDHPQQRLRAKGRSRERERRNVLAAARAGRLRPPRRTLRPGPQRAGL